MQIPPEAIVEFKAIWKKQFGEDISDEKANSEARDLLTLTRLGLGEKNVLS